MTIAEIRKSRGLTQKQLAEKIGVNVRWVQKLEKGEINIENISFLNGIKLLLALGEGEEDPVIAESYGFARTAYIMLREHLKAE